MDVVDRDMLVRVRTVLALAASSAAHIAVILAAARGASASHRLAQELQPASDPWVGDTFDVGLAAGPQGGDRVAAEPAAAESPAGMLPAVSAPTSAADLGVHAAAAPVRAPRTEHAARPRRASRPSPTASGLAAVGKSAGETHGGGGAPGAFGMQGPGQAGPRDLARAFTRAIPVAVSGDPIWATLAVGSAGSFDLKIVLGDDGRIASATPDRPVAEHLRVVAARTVSLLGTGTFAIRAEPGGGVQVLRISALISNSEGAPPEDQSSAGAYGLGFEAPVGGKPGKAHFTLRSGRHIEITVRVLPS